MGTTVLNIFFRIHFIQNYYFHLVKFTMLLHVNMAYFLFLLITLVAPKVIKARYTSKEYTFAIHTHIVAGGNLVVDEFLMNCNDIVKEGKYCPYHKNFNKDYFPNSFYQWPLNKRSTAPWVEMSHMNTGRNPRVIRWSCCACRYCVVHHRNNSTFTADTSKFSYTIPSFIKVRDAVTGERYLEEQPVGCTCGAPKMMRF